MTSSMLTERRWSSARRGGMTTLGKVAVPKPINLPSQRLESHGLKQTEEVLPKVTLSWGNRSSPSASNVWGSSTPSSNADNGTGSPSHLSGRPSSGGTNGSDRAHQHGNDNGDPNSRPPSANAALTSNQLLAISLRPHSADTRPGSSKLSRFADSNDNTVAWGTSGTTDKRGSTSSKNGGFSLSSGDFPTLGSDRETHSRPGSSSSGVLLARERTGASPAGDVFTTPPNGSGKASHDGFRGSMEMWKGERYSYRNANISPPLAPQTNTGDVYRPDISGGYNRLGMLSRPVLDPREENYGMGYSNERDVSFLGMAPGRGVYNRMASNYSRSALVSEPMEPSHLQHLRGKYTVLLEPPKAWNLKEEEQALENAVPVSTSSLEKADQPPTSWESDWIRDDHKDDDSDSRRGAADEEFSPHSVDIVNAVDELAVKEPDICAPSKIVETPRYSTLIQKIEGLNAESYVSGKEEQQLKSEVGSAKISHPLYEDSSGALSHNRALATGTISPATGVATRDKSVETSANETLFSRKVILGPHGKVAQHRGKGWFNPQEANAWQKKALTSETINGHRPDHQISVGVTEKSGSFLQGKADVESVTSILDPNDMQAQRAAMKERAKQRAEQLKKEEEERTREQKAKALAKLEELNRRSQAFESSTQKLDNHLPCEPTIATSTVEMPNSNSVSNANHTVECAIMSKDLPYEATKYTNQVPAVTNNCSSPMKSKIESAGAGDDTVTYADDSASKQKQTSHKQMLEVSWETSPNEKTSFGAIEVSKIINESEKRVTPSTEGKVVSEVAAGCKSSTPCEPNIGTSTAVVPNPALVSNNYLAAHNSVSISNRVVESAMDASKKTDQVSVTPKQFSAFEQIVNSASIADDAVSPLYYDDDVLKQKQTSYEQKMKTPLEMIPTEKPTSGFIEAPNIINESDMKATPAIEVEVASWYQSSIPVIPNVIPEYPCVDQRGKNGRSESKQYETPSIVGVPDHRYAANSLFGNGEQGPADWDLNPNPFEAVSIAKDAVQSIESNGSVINNQWKAQNLHPRSQQVNRSIEKFKGGGGDAVVWAPVRPPNNGGNNDGTSNKTVFDEESALTTRRDIPVPNNLNNSRTEVERCVRAPVAKDVAQQISIPQPISPNNKISSDEFVRRDKSDAQSAGNTQPFEIVVGKIRISTGPINWDNKQIKENGLWYPWGTTESTQMQVIQDGSSILLKPQTDVQEPVDHNQILMKPDLPSKMEVETVFSDGWNNPDEWNSMDKSNSVASVSSSIPKDQKFRSRERRQSYKERMGTGNNTYDIDHKSTRSGNKDNNVFVDRSTSQWQPKSRTYSSQNQRGSRPSGSQNVITEVTVKRESAPKDSGKATNVGHQDLKREKKTLSVKGAHVPNEGSLDLADTSSNDVLGSQHDQQLLSSGFRKNGNQNNRYVRGNESRRDWNSAGQDGKQHNQPSNRERQMNIIGPHTSNKSNNFEGPADGSSSSRFRERGQDDPMRGAGNPHGRQSGTERVDAAYDYWRTKYNTGLFDFSKFLYTLKPPGALSTGNISEENTIGADKGFF